MSWQEGQTPRQKGGQVRAGNSGVNPGQGEQKTKERVAGLVQTSAQQDS